MSSKAYKAERRREQDAADERYYAERSRLEAEHQEKFGPLLTRLEELGIDVWLLSEYIKDQA